MYAKEESLARMTYSPYLQLTACQGVAPKTLSSGQRSIFTLYCKCPHASYVVCCDAQADLMPKGTDLGEVTAWLERAAVHKRLNPIATFVVSSRTREHHMRPSTIRKALFSNTCIRRSIRDLLCLSKVMAVASGFSEPQI